MKKKAPKEETIWEMTLREYKERGARIAELEKALKLARDFIRDQQIEHALIDVKRPRTTLGKYLDKVLKVKS